MNQNTPFKIYDASAGSGKTFTLVKEYLSKILESKKDNYYQQLLALTFTNKAVTEMKHRIIENLVSFSRPSIFDEPSAMFLQISVDLNLEKEEIQIRSKKILKHLLHNYASFSVETIDRFNHRLIRTFARDLKLSSNFEVQLDTGQLLSEAVDQLLSKTGEDPKITKVLLDFALEKTDNDKSWDISKDIVQASKLIFTEKDAIHLTRLKEKSLDDFYRFKNQLVKEKAVLAQKVQLIAGNTLELISESGLEKMDFSSGYLFTHFLNLSKGQFNIKFKNKWQETMGEKPLYTGGTLKNAPDIAATIDEHTPYFIQIFKESKTDVFKIFLIDDILKTLTPLFVINLVNQELENIKEERNLLPISEFNSLINSEIKDQPAPFIYERLGEKYRHFFIDEFQDTSLLQWANLIPLIENALSQADEVGDRGSLLLVGDAKQSIYRWRGGLPEQFMALNSGFNPFFSTEKAIHNLKTNFRSCTEIIDFNNHFFSFIADIFGNKIHQNLYKGGNRQENNNKNGGYVQFEFIEKQFKKEKDKVYASLVYKTICDLKSRGFDACDICILTRSKKDGVNIGEYLMEMKIPVISAETLLLQSSHLVQCLVHTLQLSAYPENNEAKVNLLNFLHSHLSISELKHTFFSKFINTSIEQFEEVLKKYEIALSFRVLRSKSLYEGCEYLIRQFHLQSKADAYLFSFMDFIFEFENSPHSNKDGFLDSWELKKDNASIPANDGTNAVQLMTIHKAKGLEFPVVIFPYADIDIYKTKSDTIWYPLDESSGYDFDEVPINYKSQLADYSELGSKLYSQHKNTLELDAINLLYVTLTRSVEELYVFSELPTEVKDGVPKNYNQLFHEFLKKEGKWDDTLTVFEFGAKGQSLVSNSENKPIQSIPKFISTPPENHNLKIVTSEAALWDTEIQTAIDEGNLLHDIMAKIHNVNDIDFIFSAFEDRAIFTTQEIERLKIKVKSITSHPELKKFFSIAAVTKNERDIITASGMILRPDRLNFHDSNSVTIIDYKTGTPNYHHEDQINSYATALIEMGKNVSEKILVYTNEIEIVINKV